MAREMTKHYTYIIQTWYSEEDEGWVAAVVNLSTPDESVYVSGIGEDKYKALAEVSEALRSWEGASKADD